MLPEIINTDPCSRRASGIPECANPVNCYTPSLRYLKQASTRKGYICGQCHFSYGVYSPG